MATQLKGTTGSAQWMQAERDNAAHQIDDEVEAFSFSVRNELEWLNEHMGDVFTKSQLNFTDMFKTPGKLRGKTPRTVQKRDALPARQPLTDIFAPNALPAPASAQKTTFYDKVAQFQIPEDAENQAPSHPPVTRGTSPQRGPKPYTDSGYHGMMTEDEMELDALTQPDSLEASSQVGEPQKVPLRDNQPPPQRLKDAKVDETGASDDSFVSAREQDSQDAGNEPLLDHDMQDVPAHENLDEMEGVRDENAAPDAEPQPQPSPQQSAAKEQENDVDMDMEAPTPQSDASSPQKPLQRKSSFTFSSLPAREPLGAKKSMGQIDAHRSSVFNKSMTKNVSADQADRDESIIEKPIEPRAHTKSSTQLLHERLNMLGKTKEPRTSKSIPQLHSAQPAYPQLPEADHADEGHNLPDSQTTQVFQFPMPPTNDADPMDQDDDDDWIAPTKGANEGTGQDGMLSPPRPPMHQKSMSASILPSPSRPDMATETRHQKAISVSQPSLAEALESTTPVGSPMTKGRNDGPLSASKSRLWSALKSAKNIFASSASTSAAAKLEAHSNTPATRNTPVTRSATKRESGESKMFNMPGALYSQKELLQSPARNASVISFSPSRKTRNSTESDKKREKELKAQQKAADELEKAREKERAKAAKQQAEEKAKAEKAEKAEAARLEKEMKQAQKQAAFAAERPESAGSEKASDIDMPPPPPPKAGMLSTGKLRAPGKLVRPTREPAQTKPAPVSIRVPSRAGQGPSAQSSFSKSQSENSGQVPARTGSALGNRPGSAQPQNSRLRALEAAARKKEADEKAAQKKADQKRELERKRAERAEQEKRAEEERKAAERQRVEEEKLAVQRKAAEKQAGEARKREQERQDQQRRQQERLEQQRREQERIEHQRREAEQSRQQEEARKAKEAHEFAESIRRERAQQAQAHGRGDVPGTLRQLTKNTLPANAAKPAKRQFPMEEDEPAQPPQRPGILRGPASYQQTDAKRRKTNEDQEEPNMRNSVMAPPKRPSTLRKETMSKFSGYTHAPPPAAHHSSMFKATVTAQHQLQHGSRPTNPSQLVQMSNARIPFAENANPPSGHHQSQMHPGYENTQPNKFKTPARPAAAPKSAKSSPRYPQGDNIELPDIATDSEDESDDEDTGFRAPSWTASPALRDLLTQQQLVNPETVFGPIGELKMDEVFKNSKNQERLKRFRDRGSSALWTETGDAVTSAEKRKDMEMRERVVREGGWRYEPGA